MRVLWYVVPFLLVFALSVAAGCSSSPLAPQGVTLDDEWDDWPADFESTLNEMRNADGYGDPIPGPDPVPKPKKKLYASLIAWTRIIPTSQWDNAFKPNPEIGIMTTNGMNKWRFTYWKGHDDNASWKKGRALTWESDRGIDSSGTPMPSLDIYKRALNTLPPTRLTFAGQNFHPDWWEKGRIAWVKNLPNQDNAINRNGIFHMKPDGSGVMGPFGLTYGTHAHPTWVPNQKKIVFSARTPSSSGYFCGRWDIWVMNADGSGLYNLTQHLGSNDDTSIPVIFTEPAVSADGTKIAFASNYQGNFELYAMGVNAYCLVPKRLTHHPAVDRHPTWSPNGKWIAFSSNRKACNFEIYKLKLPCPDDSLVCSPVRLTWSPLPDINPDWSPYLINAIPYPGPDPIP